MKTTVNDAAALQAVGPAMVSAYLRNSGWERGSMIRGGLGSIWTRAVNGEEVELLQPLSTDLKDYPSRVAEILSLVSKIEDRDQLSVLRDLRRSGVDLLRLQVSRSDSADGTLPFESAVKAISHAKDLVLAAACMSVERKAFFPTRKPTPAVDYLKKTRFGQTEHGSFVLTIESTVPPSLDDRTEVDDPFERRVMRTLAGSLVAAKFAAQRAAAGEGIAPFRQALDQGVNANLCEAIAGILDDSDGDFSLRAHFSWSKLRPAPHPVPSSVLLTRDLVPTFSEAARVLKETAPRDFFTLVGPVAKLSRRSPDEPGKVTVLGYVDELPRKIVIELAAAEYATAIEVHQAGTLLQCVGCLVKQGSTWTLENPRDILEVPSDPGEIAE